ncbi:hypothetical protein Hanom_Chr12g01156361 [Helianthus anomalus]
MFINIFNGRVRNDQKSAWVKWVWVRTLNKHFFNTVQTGRGHEHRASFKLLNLYMSQSKLSILVPYELFLSWMSLACCISI